jgi:hypothetical protein
MPSCWTVHSRCTESIIMYITLLSCMCHSTVGRQTVDAQHPWHGQTAKRSRVSVKVKCKRTSRTRCSCHSVGQ